MVSTIAPIHVWALKTLKSPCYDIGIPFDTHWIGYDRVPMTKVLATNDPSTYAQTKEKHEWEKAMIAEYVS